MEFLTLREVGKPDCSDMDMTQFIFISVQSSFPAHAFKKCSMVLWQRFRGNPGEKELYFILWSLVYSFMQYLFVFEYRVLDLWYF